MKARLTQGQLQAIVEASPVAMYATTSTGHVMSWNPAAERLFGFSSDEALYKRLAIVPGDVSHPYGTLLSDALGGRASTNVALRMLRKDGALIDVSLTLSPLRDARDAIVGVFGIAEDVAPRNVAEQRSLEQQHTLRAILDAIPMPIFQKTIDGRYRGGNEAFLAFLGKSREEIIDKTVFDVSPPDLASIYHEADLALFRSQGVQTYDSSVVFADGSRHEVVFHKTTYSDSEGKLAGLVGTILDVTARKQAESALRESEARYRAVVSALEEGIVVVSAQRELLACNAAAERILGASRETIAQQLYSLGSWCLFDEDGARLSGHSIPLLKTLETGAEHSSPAIGVNRPDGSRLWISMRSFPVFHEGQSTPFAVVASITDISMHKAAKERLQYQAFHDELTGLPNRGLFVERLARGIALASRAGDSFAVACMDLDRFKNVNDTLGHEVGDRLLCEVARRLSACARDSDTVARMGGDEFLMILPGVKDRADAAIVAERLLAAMRPAFVVDGHELHISASIGLTLYPTDGETMDALLRNADRAMYLAKDAGKDSFFVYSPKDNIEAAARREFEMGLRRAIDHAELTIEYQPQIELATGHPLVLEALVRWNSAAFGRVMPDRLLPVAEETGLIVPLGEWVMREACMQMAKWRAIRVPLARVSVHVSQLQVSRGDFVTTVLNTLDDAGLAPSSLQLELTENAFMHDPDGVDARLADLRRRGVSIALEHFGVGYSSLGRLRRLTIDTLKIDRSFVQGLDGIDAQAAVRVLEPLIALAHGFGMRVVAEGVETLAQISKVRELGCDGAQGIAIARPQLASDICA